jgi:iron complex transport system substrate-binding protein
MANLPTLFPILALVAAFAAGPAIAQDTKPLSIVDDRGVTVEVPANPQRIATISYIAADVALALGIKPIATTYMMPGRDPDFLAGLEKGIKQIGQRAKPNLELLSEAKPDLIVAMKRYTVGNAEQLQKIAPYVAYNMELMTESYKEVAELARIMGKAERGEQLNAEFKQHLEEFAARAPKDKHPSFVIMWAGDSPSAFHNENTAASIATALGGDNIAGPMPQGGRFIANLSLETLLEKDPEVMLVMEWLVGQDGKPVRTHENNPIWQQLSAVKNGRVYYVGDQWAETNGPIAREIVLREAAHYLYPDAFPAVDVRAEAAKLMPAELQK